MAGELKHGTLALVEEETKMLFVGVGDEDDTSNKAALNQIISHNGTPIVIGTAALTDWASGHGLRTVTIPETVPELQNILNIIPMQIAAYRIAVNIGINPDKPRNLAKSVTVK
ncbi:GFA1 [Enterospora canceri]|uniref:GFA1 n=1 Tax=Enterospora canceri TaxID=1081671 RepID=A0A1Y1S947_9MICR|nr:GFA1 [Enterospora canceri]